LRLAYGEADGGLAGRNVGQKLAQPHKRRAARSRPGRRGRRNTINCGHEHRYERRTPAAQDWAPSIGLPGVKDVLLLWLRLLPALRKTLMESGFSPCRPWRATMTNGGGIGDAGTRPANSFSTDHADEYSNRPSRQ